MQKFESIYLIEQPMITDEGFYKCKGGNLRCWTEVASFVTLEGVVEKSKLVVVERPLLVPDLK